MLNEIVKRLKRTKTDWLSPNLSEAVRTTDELAHCEGYFGCDVPSNHTLFCSGIFRGMTVAQHGNIGKAMDDSIIYGYRIAFGNDKPHNNLPLSVCAYCWKRTA